MKFWNFVTISVFKLHTSKLSEATFPVVEETRHWFSELKYIFLMSRKQDIFFSYVKANQHQNTSYAWHHVPSYLQWGERGRWNSYLKMENTGVARKLYLLSHGPSFYNSVIERLPTQIVNTIFTKRNATPSIYNILASRKARYFFKKRN